jgi:DNA polymerase-3 subunit delta'
MEQESAPVVWDVVGQDRAVSLLQRSLETGVLSHAYLLVGPAHVGKMTLAVNLAQAVNCEEAEAPCGQCASCLRIAGGKHADVMVVELGTADGSTESESRVKISVEQIEQLQHSANLPPFEGRCKVFILDGAESLSIGAANRLLKTLEEPVANVLFVLTAVSEGLLPETVVSRCQRVELRPMAGGDIETVLMSRWGVESDKAALLSRIAGGCLGWAVAASHDDALLRQRGEWLDELVELADLGFAERFAYAGRLASRFGQNREAVQERLALWLDWWRDLLLVSADCQEDVTNVDRFALLSGTAKDYSLAQIRAFIDSVRATAEQLRLNANPLLALEVLMLNVPEKRGAARPVPDQR